MIDANIIFPPAKKRAPLRRGPLFRDKDLQKKVDGLLDELNDREKKIISQRFGFGGGERKTLQQIGNKLGVSRERIRQLENTALVKLRRALSQREGAIGLPVAA